MVSADEVIQFYDKLNVEKGVLLPVVNPEAQWLQIGVPTVDRRRKIAAEKEAEVHEYDRFYDVPKAEISPEHALEIERDSWSTTKILTEAFSDENIDTEDDIISANAPELIIEPITESNPAEAQKMQPDFTDDSVQSTDTSKRATENGLFAQIKAELGDIADFIELCKTPIPTEQRRFAAAHSLSVDEIADSINECAANVFGDIVLEYVGGAYGIIEDYFDQF